MLNGTILFAKKHILSPLSYPDTLTQTIGVRQWNETTRDWEKVTIPDA